MKLEHLIIELLEKGITVSSVELVQSMESFGNSLGYRVDGFSKSGYVTLYQEGEQIIALARYKEISKINSFDDLVSLAFDWYSGYKDREPFTEPDSGWLPWFVEKGWLEIKTETVTKYVVK